MGRRNISNNIRIYNEIRQPYKIILITFLFKHSFICLKGTLYSHEDEVTDKVQTDSSQTIQVQSRGHKFLA